MDSNVLCNNVYGLRLSGRHKFPSVVRDRNDRRIGNRFTCNDAEVMVYKGTIYGKVGNDYFQIGHTEDAFKSSEWVSVKDRLPEEGQTVAFVVKSINREYENNKVLGGRYVGNKYGCPGFCTPGIEWEGKYWMPLPKPPTE